MNVVIYSLFCYHYFAELFNYYSNWFGAILQVIRDKVAHYFAGKDMSPHTSQSEFRSRLDHLADDIQLMKWVE